MSYVAAVNLPERCADRTPDEELMCMLGVLEAQPRRQHLATLTPAATSVLCWHLRYGSLFMRANAAVALRQHAAYSVQPYERCMLAPSVLAALARGASARALRAQDVAPAANPPALEVRAGRVCASAVRELVSPRAL
jgi:hypothetical protein